MRTPYTPYVVLLFVACFFGLLLWWDDSTVYTQADPTIPVQLTNEHTGLSDALPTGFTELNGAVYFGLISEKHGLWKTDGTAQGTVLVKDVQMYPTSLQRVGDRLYFAAFEDDLRLALWQSDGTEAGTLPLKTDLALTYVPQLVAIGNTFYFAASDPVHGIELWQSDGTTAGTKLVADLNSGEASSYPQQLTALNGLLYFAGYNAQNRTVLWQSDGSAAGTRPVDSSTRFPQALTVMQNVLYFVGFDEAYGSELWRYTPGTPAATLVLDIFPGAESSFIEELTLFKNRLFFVASDNQHGRELWQSDGAATGTTLLKDIAPNPFQAPPSQLTVLGDQIYFRADDGNLGAELWKSDGTAAGTLPVKDLVAGATSTYPTALTTMNGQLYFLTSGLNPSSTLWKSDGTAAGTVAVLDVAVSGYYEKLFTAIGDKLYFSNYDESHGYELWVSNGTAAGTAFVKDLDSNVRGPEFVYAAQVGQRHYFVTARLGLGFYEQYKLWLSAEQGAPAILLSDQLSISQLYALADTVLINGYDADGLALWRHDGSSGPPTLVKRFTDARLLNPILLQGQLFFHVSTDTINNPPRIYDLWRSDGTAAGTMKLMTGTANNPGPLPRALFDGRIVATSNDELWFFDSTGGMTHFKPQGIQGVIQEVVTTNNAFYFVASRPGDNFADIDVLWRSDGTPQGTRPMSAQPEITFVAGLMPVGNGLYLVTARANWRSELWYTDGATPTLQLLTALTPARYYANFSSMTVINNQLFFTADDGVHGPELWRSDGTVQGTVMLKDIVPPELAAIPSAYPGPLFEFGDLLYFGANDGLHGQELWRSDGTSGGTILFKEINPTASGSSPANFVGQAGLFFFAANDGQHGRELWQSNGAPDGTRLVADLYLGSGGAYPSGRTVVSDTLYFTADNGVDGRQLFELRTGVPLALPGAGEPLPPQPHHLYFPLMKQ